MVDSLLDKKGKDITLLDLQEQAIFADYFLLCTADNERQLRALALSVVEDAKKEANALPFGKEGLPENGWMLIDFGDLIVHIFAEETREFYDLESLWTDAHVVLHMQ